MFVLQANILNLWIKGNCFEFAIFYMYECMLICFFFNILLAIFNRLVLFYFERNFFWKNNVIWIINGSCFLCVKVSNIFFFLVPPIMIFLFRPYSKRVANGIMILWILLIIIGIGSVYFHATLSLVCWFNIIQKKWI
jgi:hypothetical protein